MSDKLDCAVIGAGVVGLAIARRLALGGRSVIVLERNDTIGAETSSRNSEVIHAGIYYAAGSLKARLCVGGKAMLYRYLEERCLPHARLGKLIVAVTEDEAPRLAAVARAAEANGVLDLERLDAAGLAAREPAVRGVAALWSPSTGIVDTHALMLSLQGDIEAADGMVVLNSPVRAISLEAGHVELEVGDDTERTTLIAATAINAAGLAATQLAAAVRGVDTSGVPSVRYAKGNYFVYQGHSPFSHLVYPLPVDGGLGIHATLDMAGRLRFGPDVEWCDGVDYALDLRRRGAFYTAIRTYWPELPDGTLEPGYVGVRPKLSGPGEPAADFRIDTWAGKAGARLINLFGIESPGLTSCLAIAEHVGALADG